MSEFEISPALIGQKVCLPSRPEWGVGTVLRVQSTNIHSQPQHRVSIQFTSGHRLLHVPPARLALPGTQPQRESGWLDAAGGEDLDGRLRGLPAFAREFLGTPRQRVIMLAPLFACGAEATELVTWARAQTQVADPLSLWSRDELRSAFEEFCRRRDRFFRAAAADLRRSLGDEAVERALATIEPPLRECMRAALG